MILTTSLLLAVALGNIQAPERLSETGLYVGADTTRIGPRNLPYAPQYPLWTDGAEKLRWIFLPEGAQLDASDLDAWRFPVGTKLWKEFAFDGKKVETRLLWRAGAEQWVYATYVWNDAQSEATLAPATGIPASVEIRPGKRHSIPGIADCRACHEAGPTEVLGFNALQLSDDRDPLAPHAESLRTGMLTLGSLIESGRLDPPRREFLKSPPRIQASTPDERAALGYLTSNCGTCHNARGPLAELGLDLSYPVASEAGTPAPAIATAVDVVGNYDLPQTAEGASRSIAAGSPQRSALVYRMRSRRPSSQMPPLGSVIVDEQALQLIESWIEQGAGTHPVGSGDQRQP